MLLPILILTIVFIALSIYVGLSIKAVVKFSREEKQRKLRIERIRMIRAKSKESNDQSFSDLITTSKIKTVKSINNFYCYDESKDEIPSNIVGVKRLVDVTQRVKKNIGNLYESHNKHWENGFAARSHYNVRQYKVDKRNARRFKRDYRNRCYECFE